MVSVDPAGEYGRGWRAAAILVFAALASCTKEPGRVDFMVFDAGFARDAEIRVYWDAPPDSPVPETFVAPIPATTLRRTRTVRGRLPPQGKLIEARFTPSGSAQPCVIGRPDRLGNACTIYVRGM
jgi:hypothetical protein